MRGKLRFQSQGLTRSQRIRNGLLRPLHLCAESAAAAAMETRASHPGPGSPRNPRGRLSPLYMQNRVILLTHHVDHRLVEGRKYILRYHLPFCLNNNFLSPSSLKSITFQIQLIVT